jgi:hypothetical protein
LPFGNFLFEEERMALHPRGTLLILAAACALPTLAAGQSGYIQPSPAAPQKQQNAQPATQAPDTSSTPADESALYRYLVLVRYSYFLEYKGREKFLIQKEMRERSSQQFVERTDYESAIGIGDGEEQVMLEIVRDASPQVIETWDQIDAATMKFLEQHGSGEGILDDPEVNDLGKKLLTLVEETRANLKHEIGEEFIKKLDAYVFREFINREGPVSLEWRDSSFSGENSNRDLPSKEGSDLEQTRADRFRLMGTRSYANFIQIAGASFDHDQGNAGDINDAQRSTLRVIIPREKWQAVKAIVIDSYRRIREVFRQDDAAIGQYHRKYGPQPIPRPIPPELLESRAKFWAIVEKNITSLKGLLGQEDFKKFDESVKQVFGEKEIAAGADSANPPNPSHREVNNPVTAHP